MGEYDFLHFPAEAVQVDPMRMLLLPESARRVFGAVREAGPLTRAQLREATGMPTRTVTYAVKHLREAGLIETRCSLRDCRTCYFFVHRRCVGVEALEEARVRAAGLQPGMPKVAPRPAGAAGLAGPPA